MSERLKLYRERSKLRKELLKQTLGVRDLETALGVRSIISSGKLPSQLKTKRNDCQSNLPAKLNHRPTMQSTSENIMGEDSFSPCNSKLCLISFIISMTQGFERNLKGRTGKDGEDTEEDEFRDSKAFLKGTQSLNPHNDYSQHFVDTGQRPQNFIRDVGLADRYTTRKLVS